jgi:hypothetical protein
MKTQLVVEIRGGTLVGVYASDPDAEVHLVDWDELGEVPPPTCSRLPVHPFASLPGDTRLSLGRDFRGNA